MSNRIRIRFHRGSEIKYISHLDLMRLFERALRRSNISIIYSEGFSAHPRISLASPLPVGVTSQYELMDLYVEHFNSIESLITKLNSQLPEGIRIIEGVEVSSNEPSLQAQLKELEYEVTIKSDDSYKSIESTINSFKAKKELTWHRNKARGSTPYDLRSRVNDIWIKNYTGSEVCFGMKLQFSARPDHVISALGFNSVPGLTHRIKLILEKD
ncbi:MAG: TIGR03936 family radical SAM-associated protein [Chloroflexi bacterium]|nr:TIGR03936 family radical SAM-associated protein [Chloroflexota bacterium]